MGRNVLFLLYTFPNRRHTWEHRCWLFEEHLAIIIGVLHREVRPAITLANVVLLPKIGESEAPADPNAPFSHVIVP
jgi:hypothetical protein